MPAFQAIPQDERLTLEYVMKTGETFLSGAVVLADATPEIVEAGADPAAVLGVAAHDAAGRTVDPTKMLVHVAGENRSFLMAGTSDPVLSNRDTDYGVVKDGDGVWTVDITDTTNLVINVRDVDLERKLFEVTFLAAERQATP